MAATQAVCSRAIYKTASRSMMVRTWRQNGHARWSVADVMVWVSLGYQVGGAIAGGPLPLIATALLSYYSRPRLYDGSSFGEASTRGGIRLFSHARVDAADHCDPVLEFGQSVSVLCPVAKLGCWNPLQNLSGGRRRAFGLVRFRGAHLKLARARPGPRRAFFRLPWLINR
jgi:hypothetical protein